MSVHPANNLFPVFLKLENLNVLLVGGGLIAHEKLTAILNNSPQTKVKLVAESISDEIKKLVEEKGAIELHERKYTKADLKNINVAISAVGDLKLSEQIRNDAKEAGVLINAADKPELCDFYLGSIVQKGDLKIAISTNGKSPTMAKRIKETLNDVFPEETQEVLENLYTIRENLKGNFDHKVKTLNHITRELSLPKQKPNLSKRIKVAVFYSLVVITLMIFGHLILSYVPVESLKDVCLAITNTIDSNFLLFVAGGFIAQMIDGALGMAYGVSVTTFLLSLGIPSISPAVASASMHASEIFTTGSSSLVYMRYKNINKKLFLKLLWPGIIGAVLGAASVSFVSKENIAWIKPLVAVYTLILGSLIVIRALNIQLQKKNKIRRLFPVALIGGYLDSVGGGGWGPIVTTSLVAGGRHLRYSIGSSHLAKFFVATISTITFFFIIGLSHWQIIFGLVIGGMIAAPISIYFSNKIPTKKGLILVGTLVILISLKTILQTLLK
ncbi:MAG: TSUP family transporter [Sphingobacteriaceae bacterium]